jgi:GNAT superfamily N-acetyltransferase
MDLNTLELQPLTLDELHQLVEWAQKEGWNPGPKDAQAFWNADPDGFYGYFHKGKLIAGGAIVSYNGNFGFMGLFIVRPEYRSFGIGRKLWHQRKDLLLSRLKPGAPIGMDGVVAMQAFYEKGGFKIAFKDERYERIGTPFSIHPNVSPIQKEDLDAVLAMDKICFGFERKAFLEYWLQLPHSKTFKYIQNGELLAFAILRKVAVGYKICPLFAKSAQVAEELYKACLNACLNEPVYLDIPLPNKAAMEMVKKYKAQYVFECARMYYGTPPAVDLQQVFGITTFELG